MDASIDFSGVLRGSIADGGGGGGGDTVVITPVVTSGTKIADVSVNGADKDLYCPNPTQVSVTQEQQSGTKIGSIKVNGVEVDLYAPNPTQVNVTQVQQSGTKIATIGVNGVDTDIYAPDNYYEYSTNEHVVGVWTDGSAIYERTITLPFNTNSLVDGIFYYCDIDISQILPNLSHGWIVSDMSYFIDTSYPNDFRSFIMASFINVTTIELWTSYQRSGNATLTLRYTKNS